MRVLARLGPDEGVIVIVLAVTRIASAESRIGFYSETSVRIGAVWGETRTANYVEDDDALLLDGRSALGGELGGGTVHMRIGAVVDGFP